MSDKIKEDDEQIRKRAAEGLIGALDALQLLTDEEQVRVLNAVISFFGLRCDEDGIAIPPGRVKR